MKTIIEIEHDYGLSDALRKLGESCRYGNSFPRSGPGWTASLILDSAEAAVSSEADAVGAAGAGKTQCFDCKATMYPDAGKIWSYQCVDGRCRCPDCYDEWYPRWKDAEAHVAAATGAASGEAADLRELALQVQGRVGTAGFDSAAAMLLAAREERVER